MKTISLSRHFLVLGSLFFSLLTSGCTFFGSGPDDVKVNTLPAFSECLKVCYDSNTRARNSYTSCLDGCGRAAADYPLGGDIYSSLDRCEDEISELRAEGMPGSSRSLCTGLAGDYARLKGCEEGVANFYRVVAGHSACEPVNTGEGNILASPGQGLPEDGHVRAQDLSE